MTKFRFSPLRKGELTPASGCVRGWCCGARLKLRAAIEAEPAVERFFAGR